MPDIDHLWGNDLSVNATGDLATVDGTSLGEQRVLRRLLTNPGEYIWHPEYGAGLPQKVGSLLDIPALKALITAQMFQEAAVSRTPLPVITVSQTDISTASIQISYVDAQTGEQASLSFDLNG
jgi:phage baseplate assembly protein W